MGAKRSYGVCERVQMERIGCMSGAKRSHGMCEEVHGEHMGCMTRFRGEAYRLCEEVQWGIRGV